MKIEKINKLTEIPGNSNNTNIGLFTDNFQSSLLFFCNLLDDNFFYYDLEEEIIIELAKSSIKFDVLLINKSLSSNSIKLLFKYSKKHNVKLIYAPPNVSDLNSQKDFIEKYDLIVVKDSNLKNSLKYLTDNILFIPDNLKEEYNLIKKSELFDEKEYASRYNMEVNDNFDSVLHYLTVGFYENCNPFKESDLDTFLNAYPEIKKYDINAFTYYLILKQLFRIMEYYPFDNIIYQPSIFRLLLWDNKFFEHIKVNLQKEYKNVQFEITEESNKLLFKQKNKLSNFKYDFLIDTITKTNLIIKNRNTGKRILKEIKNYEVEITENDLLELDILGVYDLYVQISTLNKDLLFRVNFDEQNSFKILKDYENCRVFDPYETLDNRLSFIYQETSFVIESMNVISENSNILIEGELVLIDNLNFDSVELVMFLNKDETEKKYILCDYEKSENSVKFSALIDFEYRSTDLGNRFKIDVRLKDVSGKILDSNIYNGHKANNLRDELRKFVKKTVFFESFHGKFYSGQPKYIYEKMLDRGLDEIYDFVWAYKGELEIPGSPLITSRSSENYKEILASSDYWITNISFPFLKPDEDIVYVQTTHGTPYKRMGADIESNDENIARGRVLIESDTWNYIISPNDYSKEIFARSFEYDGTIINEGYPANDIFYEDTTTKEQNLKNELNIDPDKKIILYCPTFRDYEKSNKDGTFSYILDLEKLYHAISDEYIILLRLHYTISKHLILPEEMRSSIIDLSDYNDVADLYLISDILITDYSSVFFDFAHSKKPILFYVPDFEKYSSFRGLYSEVKENLPGPELYTDDELIECIENIDEIEKEFKEKYEKFYEKFCGIGHGTASEEVVNIIFGEVDDE